MKKVFMNFFILFIAISTLSLNAKEQYSMNITHMIIPAAGLGTRFLPLTKSTPKEMVTLFNKPALHYIVEEGVGSGINHMCIITNKDKPAIEHYFSPDKELDNYLTKKNKSKNIEPINNLIGKARFSYINQEQALGLGHAVLLARPEIGNVYFAICLPDDLTFGNDPAIGQMAKIAKKYKVNVIGVQEVPLESISAYGVINPLKKIEDGVFDISSVVEKPSTEDAPSNLAIVGRYIFSPKLFDALEKVKPSLNGEILLTDAFDIMIDQGEKIYAYVIKGRRHDTGQPHGWLGAVLDLAMQNPKYAQQVKEAANKKCD